MRYLIYLSSKHARKFGLFVVLLSHFYVYAQVLVFYYIIGLMLSCIHQYPRNFPPYIFLPLLYSAAGISWIAAMYQGRGSGTWIFILPMPLILLERKFRLIGLPLYAFMTAMIDAVARYRDPPAISIVMEEILLQDYIIERFVRTVPWNFLVLLSESFAAFVVCFLYGFIVFFNEPQHVHDALRDAARGNDYEQVERALDRGADPNKLGIYGLTSLHICAQQSTPRIGKLLLEKDADPNSKDQLGMTPLHWAVQYRREEESTEKRMQMIQLLLKANADPHIPDHRGITAYSIAREQENAFALVAINSLFARES